MSDPHDNEGKSLRALPSNIEVEAALLGALLVRNGVYDDICEILRPEHFYEAVHGRIYAAAGRLIERQKEASANTLSDAFKADPGLEQSGGGAYLYDLVASVISVHNVVDYAHIIRDLYMRREIIVAAETARENAYAPEGEESAFDQIEAQEQQLADIAANRIDDEARSLHEAGRDSLDMAEAAYQNRGRVMGVPTGLADVDEDTGGMTAGELVVLAGATSMGKSALAMCIATNAARRGKKVLVFSLEMSSEQIAQREQAKISGVSSSRIKRGQIDLAEWESLIDAQDDLANVPVTIDDSPSLTVSAMRSRARRLKRRQGIDLIIVDYLQLIAASAEATRKNSRVAEVSDITRTLKIMAKDIDVPVLALSQLSRTIEGRDNKRPRMSDLKESGSIEQDADAIWFVFREEYYLKNDAPVKGPNETAEKHKARWDDWVNHLGEVRGLAELIIAKQRQGPTSTIKLHFDGPLMNFTNWAAHEPDPGDLL